jgi:hypothetical protein
VLLEVKDRVSPVRMGETRQEFIVGDSIVHEGGFIPNIVEE